MTSPSRAVAEPTQESITWRTPLVTIPWTPDLDMTQVIVASARSVVGVDASDPDTRPILKDLLGPVHGQWDLDRPFGVRRDATGQYVTQGVSTCGLVATGL